MANRKPTGTNRTFYISEDDDTYIDRSAKERGMSRSAIVAYALRALRSAFNPFIDPIVRAERRDTK